MPSFTMPSVATADAPVCTAPTPQVEVRLLDGFDLVVDGRSYSLPPSAQRLVAYLALQPRPVVRAHVAGFLWRDHSDDRAAACLRSAVWRSNSGTAAHVVRASRSRLELDPAVAVDVRTAVAAAHSQLAGAAAPVAPDLLCGELLPGWYDDWVLVEREHLRQLCLQAMERMAEALLSAGQVHLAIEAAVSIVAAEPLREPAYRVLVEAYVAAGNRGEALRQFERCRALLHDELGLRPGEALTAAAARACGPAAATAGARLVLQRTVADAR